MLMDSKLYFWIENLSLDTESLSGRNLCVDCFIDYISWHCYENWNMDFHFTLVRTYSDFCLSAGTIGPSQP